MEYRFDSMPTEWAATQRDLGHVLLMIGRAGDASVMEQAVAAYTGALQVQTRGQHLAEWAMTTCYRAVALAELGRIRSDGKPLRQAAEELAEALQEAGHELQPSHWTCIQHHYGAALLALAQLDDEPALRQAIIVLREALEVPCTVLGRLADWAALSGHIGGALLHLTVGSDTAALDEARDVLSRARERLEGEFMAANQTLPVGDLAQHVIDELLRLASRQPIQVPGMRDLPRASGTVPSTGSAGSRVLVVEDSEVDQAILQGMLEQCIGNLELCIHDTGAAALENVLQYRPDLLILDLNLPDMQGGEVLACVRAINPWLPVLLYSGDPVAMSRLRNQAGAGQSIATLKKGCTLDEFRNIVPGLFKRRQRDTATGQLVGARA